MDTTSPYKTENGDNLTSLFPNWVVTPIWMMTYFTLFFLFIIFCKVIKYMHISNYPEPSSLCSGEVKRHSLPLRWPRFEYWIDTKNFIFSLCQLPCFSRHVKPLVPRLSVREDLTVVAWTKKPILTFYHWRGNMRLDHMFTTDIMLITGVLPVHNLSSYKLIIW